MSVWWNCCHVTLLNDCFCTSWVLTLDHIIRDIRAAGEPSLPSTAASKENFSVQTSHPWRQMSDFTFFETIKSHRLYIHTHTHTYDMRFEHNKDGNGLSAPTVKTITHVLPLVLLSSIKSVWSLMSDFFYAPLSCWLIFKHTQHYKALVKQGLKTFMGHLKSSQILFI